MRRPPGDASLICSTTAAPCHHSKPLAGLQQAGRGCPHRRHQPERRRHRTAKRTSSTARSTPAALRYAWANCWRRRKGRKERKEIRAVGEQPLCSHRTLPHNPPSPRLALANGKAPMPRQWPGRQPRNMPATAIRPPASRHPIRGIRQPTALVLGIQTSGWPHDTP